MMTPSSNEVSLLLVAWEKGDRSALDKLIPLVYEELHRLAARYMRGENAGHTFQTTALVNEAFLKLVDQKNIHWQNRAHFFSVAAQLMRRILVDHARSRSRLKRGRNAYIFSLDETAVIAPTRTAELISLDDALNVLAEIDPRKTRIVEMKFFAGLTTEEIAEVEKVSARTIEREWRTSKAWLYKEIKK